MRKRPSLEEVHNDIKFDLDNSKTVPQATVSVGDDSFKVVEIPLTEIELDKNIRDSYTDDALDELGESILENGQIQPIIVYRNVSGKYIIKVGHRRYKACLIKDIPTIKCIVEEDFKTEKERIITQAIENEQRLNLSSRERESYIAQLIDLGLSQVEISKALHKTKGWVSEALTAHNFVKENKELFDNLSEEPSTRDVWIASKLPSDERETAFSEAKKQGGTKEAIKKELSKRYNSSSKNITKNLKNQISCVIDIAPDDKIYSFSLSGGGNKKFLSALKNFIDSYYTKLGYSYKEKE